MDKYSKKFQIIMSELKLSYSGYVCAPYLHNRDSLELKESWTTSKNIEKLYFVTGSFSSDSQPYFSLLLIIIY